jgi:ABC-type Fe3+/spermidine/putrescine transport system ATPase subunit
MGGLETKEIYKSFGDVSALHGLSLSVDQGEILAVLGPSGCGKSTLLSIIAGLEEQDRGGVLWDGQSLDGVPPHRRGFGLMFQDFALFPHMNVADNVAFGLRMAGLDERQQKKRSAEMLDLVGLSGYGERDTSTLSGGESQRVALARAIAPQPRLLMLDEPLGSLDRTLRERLMGDLGTILRGLNQTAIYVTHDQEEAFSLADQVVLMNAGQAAQAGTPEQIYRQPASPFVARFLGFRNLLDGEAQEIDGKIRLRTAVGDLAGEGFAAGPVTVLIRPDQARLEGNGDIRLEGVVLERTFRGDQTRLKMRSGKVDLIFDFPSSTVLPTAGQTMALFLDAEDSVMVWDVQGKAHTSL